MNELNNLPSHIKQVLQNHEEPYDPGAWERFQKEQNRQKNHVNFYRIAASIILGIALALAWGKTERPPEEQLANKMSPNLSQTEAESSLPVIEKKDLPSKRVEAESKTNSPVEYTSNEHNLEEIREENLRKVGRLESLETKIPRHISKLNFATLNELNDTELYTDSLKKENSSANQKHSEVVVQAKDLSAGRRQKDLELSFAYASVMNMHKSQTDIGIGGGIYASWNFANNLSATTGIFITQNNLKYDENPRVLRAIEEAGDSEYMQLDLVNLEIPLHMSFAVTDQISMSAGITSVAFLKEQYNYVYTYEKSVPVTEHKSGEEITRTVKVTASETHTQPSFNSINWGAFYTFSVGYQRKLLSQQLVLEPFLKIPASRIASQNIRYSTVGVQLKVTL